MEHMATFNHSSVWKHAIMPAGEAATQDSRTHPAVPAEIVARAER